MKIPDPINFSSDEEKVRWIEDVMTGYRDGTATPEDIASFRALLLEDGDARRIYFESNQLTSLLEVAGGRSGIDDSKPKIISTTRLRRVITWAAAGVAAALAIGFWMLSPDGSSDPVEDGRLATLSNSLEAVWIGRERSEGSHIENELLKLQAGIVEITFGNGARFVFEGPCELEIVDQKTIRLTSGKLWGHCPPEARGFEVLAPGGHRVVDLGTEFGVGVAPNGTTDVHVFDGEVEVFPSELAKHSLEAGSAIQLVPGADSVTIDADIGHFTSAEELHRERWNAHHESMLRRDDLLLYYDFDSVDDVVKDLSGKSFTGQVSGAFSVSGHVPGGRAMLFEAPTDAVALDFGELTLSSGFTVAMWIKPNELTRSHAALLNSNGFDSGGVHFQISHAGNLLADIRDVGSFRTKSSDFLQTNEWQLVAVTWDLETRRPKFFHNAALLEREPRKRTPYVPGTIAKFGRCQIGGWGERTYGHRRNFVGRIDEVMVFSRVLEAEEIRALFNASRP